MGGVLAFRLERPGRSCLASSIAKYAADKLAEPTTVIPTNSDALCSLPQAEHLILKGGVANQITAVQADDASSACAVGQKLAARRGNS
ncbi:hypothetical protein [Methylobacterium oryzisoli]|uniref:hypothetical protein n=1 Tax=Methylobacterium oryzisoli TaxID=3385502 RepID=UPI00389138B2